MGMAIKIGGLTIPGSHGSGLGSSYWATRFPSDLIVEVISDSQIDLSWENNGLPTFDNIIIERSLDSITWSELATLSSSTTTYSDEDVTAYSVIYYYRVHYVKGTSCSVYTRITSMFWDEKINDGDFAIGGGYWHGQSVNNWSISGGEAIFSAATALNKTLFRSNAAIKTGRTYRISFEVTDGLTPTFKITSALGDSLFSGALNDYATYSVGVHSFDAVCIADSDSIGITGDNTAGTFSLTSFSIKDRIYPFAYKVLTEHTSGCLYGSDLYAISGQYLEKSTDFGDTWERIDHEFIGTMRSCFVSKDGILFVNCGTMGAGGTEIWRSTNNGLNWTKVMNTNYGEVRVPWNFTQASNGIMFIGEYTAAYNSAYLWKSTDNGENWTRIDYFFEDYTHFHQVFVDPETQRLYVALGDTTMDTYYSDDEGNTWHQMFTDAGFETGFVSITSIPDARYFGTDTGGGSNAIYKTTDDLALVNTYKPPERYDTCWMEVVSVEGTEILYASAVNIVSDEYSALLAKSLNAGDTWDIIQKVENSTSNFLLPLSDYKHRIPADFGYLITRTQADGLIRISKEIETWDCLVKPSGVTLTLITGGVRIDWVDNTSGRLETEIWAQTDELVDTFITTIEAGISTYDHICNTVHYPRYKLRTKIRLSNSEFTDEVITPISYFKTTWNTENVGSATKTVVIPTTGAGFDCYITWDDEAEIEHITGTPGNITHVFDTTGIKTIKIAGAFPRIYFNGGGDCLKLLTIESWGGTVWANMASAFRGCINLVGNYTDIPDVSKVADFAYMFSGCQNFNSPVNFNTISAEGMACMFLNCKLFNQSVSSFNTSNVKTMLSMFNGCSAFDQSVANFNTAKVTTMASMFRYCTVFNQSLATFNVQAVTTMATMLLSANTWSTTNYDATLIAWAAQTVQSAVLFHAGDAKYSAGAAATARGVLASVPNSWDITDGGQV